ncbi:hypothetical protein BAUCODRAFT_121202 [Baudoinia panamericana UAMH 10762]|uniref:Uncharacterized protein n=1 Tax=Baudoinia panamericana (strain UAMH 10762) TaxID=717646 RepID=M2LUP9_BAUPA|nr:uncharacterized protein BAUCODRAFT_121202 [Baudoinia panamericana UAMH 10762]EMC98327.1 hypothetical protein BAUCODRAFT_121202 [Baudoinia panamericana UAMH 10762]
MGVRASELAGTAEPSPALPQSSDTSGARSVLTGSEYPPEKVGWHEGNDFKTPMPTPRQAQERKSSAVSVGGPLDISRLVTLPPPYPRHHPALNNSHPMLADLRNEHRTMTNHIDIQQIKNNFLDRDFVIRKQHNELAKERRARLHSGIQTKLGNGTMSFAQAAQEEAAFDKEEAERGKAEARTNFERYETQVAQPLNELLLARLKTADECIERLKLDLETSNHVADPNQAQEEGDEQPERLEKLTLLKWLFEAREQLHTETFDLHANRSEQYSEVILTPYRIQRAQAKIDEATAFFGKDSRDRQLAFARDFVKRHEELQRIVEMHVSRGVEDQMSAFWDIAPSLLDVATGLPSALEELDIHIPELEYEENPSYHDHPLQYLYCLLSHAEKSAYQFIESEINLLCLLHEVRTASTKGHVRLVEIHGSAASPHTPDRAVLQEAEERLTQDLKEKVGEVEKQWREALGDGLEDCRARVKGYLQISGGWEDGLDG